MKSNQRNHLISLYLTTINSTEQSIRQTIVSVWSATALYILIYGSAISFSFNLKVIICQWIVLGIFISSIFLTYLFAIFIFAQFSGWIFKRSVIYALRIGIIKLSKKDENITTDDIQDSQDSPVPRFVFNEYNKYKSNLFNLGEVNAYNSREKKSKNHGVFHSRPMKEIRSLLTRSWRTKLRQNRDRQEAVIYWILILFWMLFAGLFILKHLTNVL